MLSKTTLNVEDNYENSRELKSAAVDKQNQISIEMDEALVRPETGTASCRNSGMDIRNLNHDGGKAVFSPFHELGLTEEGDFNVDKTPEITQLTKSMKEVSPFQELAVTDIDLINETFLENPFTKNADTVVSVGQQRYVTNKSNYPIHSQIFEGHVYKRQPVKRPSTEMIQSNKELENFSRNSQTNLCYRTYTPADSIKVADDCTESKVSRVHCTTLMNNTGLLVDTLENDKPQERDIPISRSLFEETTLSHTEKQVDCLEDDSEDWFNDVLVGVEDWLK